MASLDFHNIMDEKANAMTRYHERRELKNMLRLFNIGAALFFFFRSSWFSIVVDILSHLNSIFALLFNSTFCMFLLGNVIILFVYALSDYKDGKTGDQSDIYDEFLNNSESRLKISADGGPPSMVNNTDECSVNSSGDYTTENEITRSEHVESESRVPDRTVTAVTETRTTTCCTTVSMTTNGEKDSWRKCYQRFESEIFERQIVVAPRRELNRVDTAVGREMERRLCSVEELTNEEFNRAVEEFIAKHKRKQREEHKGSEYLYLTH